MIRRKRVFPSGCMAELTSFPASKASLFSFITWPQPDGNPGICNPAH